MQVCIRPVELLKQVSINENNRGSKLHFRIAVKVHFDLQAEMKIHSIEKIHLILWFDLQ